MTATSSPPTTAASVVRDDTTGALWGLGSDGCWRCLDSESDGYGYGAEQIWTTGDAEPGGCRCGEVHTFTVLFDAAAS